MEVWKPLLFKDFPWERRSDQVLMFLQGYLSQAISSLVILSRGELCPMDTLTIFRWAATGMCVCVYVCVYVFVCRCLCLCMCVAYSHLYKPVLIHLHVVIEAHYCCLMVYNFTSWCSVFNEAKLTYALHITNNFIFRDVRNVLNLEVCICTSFKLTAMPCIAILLHRLLYSYWIASYFRNRNFCTSSKIRIFKNLNFKFKAHVEFKL